jgi:hypothetical protein
LAPRSRRAGLYPALLKPELRTAAAMEAFLAKAPPNLTNMAQWARGGFLSEHLVRPGEDGDIVYKCARRAGAQRRQLPCVFCRLTMRAARSAVHQGLLGHHVPGPHLARPAQEPARRGALRRL